MSTKKTSRYQRSKAVLLAGSFVVFTAVTGFLGARGVSGTTAQAATPVATQQASSTGSTTQATSKGTNSSQQAKAPVAVSRGS